MALAGDSQNQFSFPSLCSKAIHSAKPSGLRPYPGDYPYHFKADAVGCKFLLTCSHLSAFLWITACGGSIAQTGPGHHETSPANSITRFTDGRIKTRAKLAWYGSSTTWTRCVTNGPSFPASAQPTIASPIPQAPCPGIVYSSPGNCGRFPSPSSPIDSPKRVSLLRRGCNVGMPGSFRPPRARKSPFRLFLSLQLLSLAV